MGEKVRTSDRLTECVLHPLPHLMPHTSGAQSSSCCQPLHHPLHTPHPTSPGHTPHPSVKRPYHGGMPRAGALHNPLPHLQVTLLILLSTACIIGGCLVLVLFGDHSNVVYTVDQLMALYRE